MLVEHSVKQFIASDNHKIIIYTIKILQINLVQLDATFHHLRKLMKK